MGNCAEVYGCLKKNSEVKAEVIPEGTTCNSHFKIKEKEKPKKKPKPTKNIKFTLDEFRSTTEGISKKNPKKIQSTKDCGLRFNLENFEKRKPRLTTKFLFASEEKKEEENGSTKNLPKPKVNEDLTTDQEAIIRKVLIDNNLVNNFDEDTLDEFIIGFFSIELQEKTTLYEKGTDAKVFYIIEDGIVELESDGNIEKLTKMNYFGIEALDDTENDNLREQNAISVTSTKLLGVSGEFYRSALTYMDLKEINEKLEIIKKMVLFSYLDQSKQIGLCKHLTFVAYKPNSIVINENEMQDRLFFIDKGSVRVTRKFKKVDSLDENQLFGQIGLFMKFPSDYTYSVDKQQELYVYELFYSDIKAELGNSYIKDILFQMFKKALASSEKINDIILHLQSELFNIFKLIYYEKGQVVFLKDSAKNKKICIVISGTLSKMGRDVVVAGVGDLYGQDIIDAKQDLDCNIISSDVSLVLESSWEDIIKTTEHYATNNIGLVETVNKLKQIPLFSTLRETEYLELAKNITIENFKDSEVISREGDLADKFFIIKTGKVKMQQKGKFIRELDVGGCFGEIPNLTGEIRLFTVISFGGTECYVLTKDDFSSFDYEIQNKIKDFSSLNDTKISLSDLYYVKTLGNGRFGKVFLVHNQKHFYAIKYASIETIYSNKNLAKYYLNEKKIMLQIDHPFIIKLVKTLKDPNFLYFILEYIDGVPLKSYLEKKKKNKQKNAFEAEFYGGILLVAINYLHNKKILHRDIKPDNCMIDKTGYLKLIDFGIAKDLKKKEMTNTICGTPHYLAPEVIMGKGYSFSSDYWSIGVTMFEIFYGYVPFGQSAKDVMGVYYEILNKKLVLPYEPKFNDINSFFRIILSKNLMQRVCNFNLLRSHPFFHQFDFDQLSTFAINPPYVPESYIEQNNSFNNNVIGVCNIPIMNYITVPPKDVFGDDAGTEEKYMEDKKYLDEF